MSMQELILVEKEKYRQLLAEYERRQTESKSDQIVADSSLESVQTVEKEQVAKDTEAKEPEQSVSRPTSLQPCEKENIIKEFGEETRRRVDYSKWISYCGR